MTVFAGLDLAWTTHRETGVCVFEGDAMGLRLEWLGAVVATPCEFADWLEGLGNDVVAAIDAPLVVEEGRWAERALGRVFGRYQASAYTASLAFLSPWGLAGPRLGRQLRGRGFSLDPAGLTEQTAGRFAFEMYPHAAHIAMFGLERILKYKKGHVDTRREALRTYQRLLSAELAAFPAVGIDSRLVAVLDPGVTEARGRALKHLEDQLDALTCALVAYRCWLLGPAGYSVFGCARHGYIVTPGLPPGATTPPAECGPCSRARPSP